MSKNPSVVQMVELYLREHGYTGLYNVEIECGCSLEEFIPCGELGDECLAGYVTPSKCPGIENDFFVGLNKSQEGETHCPEDCEAFETCDLVEPVRNIHPMNLEDNGK